MRRPFLLVVGAAVMALAAPTLLPDAASTADSRSDQVDPAECRVAPMSLASFLALQATPSTAEWTPRNVHYEPPVPLPRGRPADDATIAALTAALRELAACQESGNDLRGLRPLQRRPPSPDDAARRSRPPRDL